MTEETKYSAVMYIFENMQMEKNIMEKKQVRERIGAIQTSTKKYQQSRKVD